MRITLLIPALLLMAACTAPKTDTSTLHIGEPVCIFDGADAEPRLTFTEGPAWFDGRLYFSNYYYFWKEFGTVDEGGICVVNEDGSGYAVLNPNVQTNGMAVLTDTTVAVCDMMGRALLEVNADGVVVDTLVTEVDGMRIGAPNDVCVDSRGGIYFSVPVCYDDESECPPGATAYYRAPNGVVRQIIDWDAFRYPNGCALSPDGSLFYIDDSFDPVIYVYDVMEDGGITNKRPFCDVGMGVFIGGGGSRGKVSADGMTVDKHGNVFIAVPSGVKVFTGAGEQVKHIETPVNITNCVVGGDEDQYLFMTGHKQIFRCALHYSEN